MNNAANLQLFSQTTFDSGALSGLGSVVHYFEEAGEHHVTVLHKDAAIHTLSLRVIEKSEPTQAATPPPSSSSRASNTLHIDLSRAGSSTGNAVSPLPETLVVLTQGYAIFHSAPGAEGYAVQLKTLKGEIQSPGFDSRQLRKGDIFTATLLRPGRYSIINTETKAKGEIRVAYPVIGNTPYSPPEPIEVQVSEQGFYPHMIELKPAQGLILKIGNVTARILIELVEPDDGPSGSNRPSGNDRKPGFNWEKPKPPDAKSAR